VVNAQKADVLYGIVFGVSCSLEVDASSDIHPAIFDVYLLLKEDWQPT